MNLLDIILGIILIFSFISGMKKGLFVTLASFIGLILGVIGAVYFSEYTAVYLYDWFHWSEQTTNLLSRLVTFIAIILIISWLGKFLTNVANFAFLGIFNKILGGVFNALISAFIISLIFMFFTHWNPTNYVIPEDKVERSYLYGPVTSIAPLVLPNLIEEVENFEIPENVIHKIQTSEKQQDSIVVPTEK